MQNSGGSVESFPVRRLLQSGDRVAKQAGGSKSHPVPTLRRHRRDLGRAQGTRLAERLRIGGGGARKLRPATFAQAPCPLTWSGGGGVRSLAFAHSTLERGTSRISGAVNVEQDLRVRN